MKSLIVSFVSIAVIIGGWLIFVGYADKNIHELVNAVDDRIIASVYAGDWEDAAAQIQRLSDQWHDHKKIYTFFFNTSSIMETEYAIAQAEYYIKSKDTALSAGELILIKEQLGFLHLNELITLDNIF